MSEQSKNMNHYSLEDIQRYLQGKLSPAEMHELEKAAVQDPFLADAIEGYQSIDQEDVTSDLAHIHARLSSGPAKVIPAVTKQNTWWRVAAAVILLAGTGILGLKVFTGKKIQELAKMETVASLKKNTSRIVADSASKPDTTVALQKKELLASNSRLLPSLKKSRPIDNSASLDKQPVASVSTKPLLAKDTMLLNQMAARDIVAASTSEARTSALLAQAKSAEMNMHLNKPTDPALAAKTTSINPSLAKGNIIGGAGMSLPRTVGKVEKIKGDTLHPDRSKMPVFSQAGYSKSTEPGITVTGGLQSNTVTGNIMAAKRSGISIDTPVLIDQKKMYTTLSEIATTSASASPRFEQGKLKKDTDSMLAEVVITGNSNYRYDKSPKKELSRSNSAAPGNSAGREFDYYMKQPPTSAIPKDGWPIFQRYLTDKIAAETSIQKETSTHGPVEIKININKNGKVTKVTILNSFNTQLNPFLIKAIRRGPHWVTEDHLAKTDFIFTITL